MAGIACSSVYTTDVLSFRVIILIHKIFLVLILLAFLVCPLIFIIYTYSTISRDVTVLLRKERSSTLTGASDKAGAHERISKAIHENTSEQLLMLFRIYQKIILNLGIYC